jgi:hypothetical protein
MRNSLPATRNTLHLFDHILGRRGHGLLPLVFAEAIGVFGSTAGEDQVS